MISAGPSPVLSMWISVQDVLPELKEVRTAVGVLQGQVVGDDGHRSGLSGLTNAYRSVLSATGSFGRSPVLLGAMTLLTFSCCSCSFALRLRRSSRDRE